MPRRQESQLDATVDHPLDRDAARLDAELVADRLLDHDLALRPYPIPHRRLPVAFGMESISSANFEEPLTWLRQRGSMKRGFDQAHHGAARASAARRGQAPG